MSEEQLLQACEEFWDAVDLWTRVGDEWNGAIRPCEFSYVETRKIKRRWREALEKVRGITAVGREGLEAKREMLISISHFAEAHDPSYALFAVELVQEYHEFLFGEKPSSSVRSGNDLRPGKNDNESPCKSASRLNIKSLFSFLSN
jgi:hypothetical protein